MSNGIDWLFGLERFIELFSYFPSDITSFLLSCLAILVVLGLRRVLY